MIITGVADGGTGDTILCVIPPGQCNVVLQNMNPGGTTAPTVYVGMGSAIVSATANTSGLPLYGGAAPTTFFTYQGSQGGTMYVGKGTAAYLISTDE